MRVDRRCVLREGVWLVWDRLCLRGSQVLNWRFDRWALKPRDLYTRLITVSRISSCSLVPRHLLTDLWFYQLSNAAIQKNYVWFKLLRLSILSERKQRHPQIR
jgi:hypothetical protein